MITSAIALMTFCLGHPVQDSQGEWSAYGRDLTGRRYSELAVIRPDNVAKLERAWTYRTGDLPVLGEPGGAIFECTPIYVNDTLYGVTPHNEVFALDPDTGKPRWTYDPKVSRKFPEADETYTCRGVSSWRDPKSRKFRIVVATHDARLILLDAQSGKVVPSFGKEGVVALRELIGPNYRFNYNETSAPCIVDNLVIVGSSIGDNSAVNMPSGKIQAFDLFTGRRVWAWEPLAMERAENGDRKVETSGRKQTGAANAWSTISADPIRHVAYVTTGSPSPDFAGTARPGDNRDANSIVALDTRTGERKWAFQVVHHDLWDYDIPAQPILADIAGRPVVIAMTKMGFVYVLDRDTGKSVFPVEERRVPMTSIPGEGSSPTQPFPVLPKPLVPSKPIPWGLTSELRDAAANRLAELRNEGIFTPPSTQGTVVYPGNLGGSNWSGGSFLPESGTLFVNTNNVATVITLIKREELRNGFRKVEGSETNRMDGTPYGMRRQWLTTDGAVPQTSPPWGALSAVDMKTGALKWQVPLGYVPSLSKHPDAKKWGSLNTGGSFVTTTGLVFISASMDGHLRAFDAETGAIKWEYKLPRSGNATPMTFRSRRTGIQYVVQCAGGSRSFSTPAGDYVIAFRLPKAAKR